METKASQDKLFGEPVFEKIIVIPDNFSLDRNVVPKVEFNYSLMPGGARDEYFDKLSIFGSRTLKIFPLTQKVPNWKLMECVNNQDALAIVAALQEALKKDLLLLKKTMYGEIFASADILVPVSSIKQYNGFMTGPHFFSLQLELRDNYIGWTQLSRNEYLYNIPVGVALLN